MSEFKIEYIQINQTMVTQIGDG